MSSRWIALVITPCIAARPCSAQGMRRHSRANAPTATAGASVSLLPER